MARVRLLVIALLILVAALARGDGFAYGEHFPDLKETRQAVLIHLAPNKVTVDMYIAIDGIPKGETVTYVLPFWSKPEGFTLEEVGASEGTERSFYDTYLRPTYFRMLQENDHPERQLLNGVAIDVGMNAFGAGFMIPQSVSMIVNMSMTSMGVPYNSEATTNARAELFQVDAADLPALVAQSGLPDRYADALKRYHTSYFAVMRLTGVSKDANRQGLSPRGVHYHFTHTMPGSAYTYIYPLGTGAAWAKPILFTEVYAVCDEGYEIHADAPILGNVVDYDQVTLWGFNDDHEQDAPVTAMLVPHPEPHPTSWHIAYYQSNPNKDIVFQFRPSGRDRWSTMQLTFRQTICPFLLPLLAVAAAWALSALLIIRPAWRKAYATQTDNTEPHEQMVLGTLGQYVLPAILRTLFWSVLWVWIVVMFGLIWSPLDHQILMGLDWHEKMSYLVILVAPVAAFFINRAYEEKHENLYPLLTRRLLFVFYLLSMVLYCVFWWLGMQIVQVV